jgi:hypothetical protein
VLLPGCQSGSIGSEPTGAAPAATVGAGEKTETPQAVSLSGYRSLEDASPVDGAPTKLSLGFNNAEQVVEADGDNTYLVWVAANKLQLATRNAAGDVVQSVTIATGPISLPAIARTGQSVGVAWVERSGEGTLIRAAISHDGGASFPQSVSLGAGAGVSLAASEGKFAAVWHDGEEFQTAKVMLSVYDGGGWSSASRVDASNAAPVWAAVAAEGNRLFVAWRDNRAGPYTIWFRRSADWGRTWEPEQQLTTASSGDPDVCVDNGGTVWLAHHGQSQISLLRSLDGGVRFGPPQTAGNGWFAHLSCTEAGVAVGWEATTGPARADNKQAGWALFNAAGSKIGIGALDGDTAAATVYLDTEGRLLEVLWVRISAGEPLAGTLVHSFFELYWTSAGR